MAHLTVGLPEDLYERIKKHREIKWAAVAREAMIKYLGMIEEAKKRETENRTTQVSSKN